MAPKKPKNPDIDACIEIARKRVLMSDGDSQTMIVLAEEVIALRNAMPCERCKGTGRMCIGEAYMGGPEQYDNCDKCKKHIGKKFKQTKAILT